MNGKTLEGVEFDKKYFNQRTRFIAGADEVGRGPLAGPVVVAAVIMDYAEIIDGVKDSKTISEKKREKLYEQLIASACSVGIGWVDSKEIDEINILNATRKAFSMSIEKLSLRPDFILMDYITGVETAVPFETIKKGDAKSYIIGCASIIAKVTRDRFMIELDEKYPGYGFARNKGYGTREHIEALKKFGPCPIHRKTFIKNFTEVQDERFRKKI